MDGDKKKNQPPPPPQDTIPDLKLFLLLLTYLACFTQNHDVWEKDGIWN